MNRLTPEQQQKLWSFVFPTTYSGIFIRKGILELDFGFFSRF